MRKRPTLSHVDSSGKVRMEERSFNSDASIVHTSWTYDGSGRVVEVKRWCDKWSSRTKCLYNSQGHPLRTIDVAPDGTERVAETWGIDELGRRTRVQFLPPVQTLPVSKYDDEEAALGTGYGIPNAVTATSVYDVEDRIIEVRYHDGELEHQGRQEELVRRQNAGFHCLVL